MEVKLYLLCKESTKRVQTKHIGLYYIKEMYFIITLMVKYGTINEGLTIKKITLLFE